jgi:cytochrome c
MRANTFLLYFVLIALLALMNACSSGQSTSAPNSSSAADAKSLKNPIPATPQSIASGKRLFARFCADCHGEAGNGVSAVTETLSSNGGIKPPDLTDDKWDHGSTDGEIFVNIRDGVGGTMRGLNGKPGIADREMWDIVNYIRSIGPKAP